MGSAAKYFSRFPSFMPDVKEVTITGPTTSHWVAGPLGKTVEWDAEITEDVPKPAHRLGPASATPRSATPARSASTTAARPPTWRCRWSTTRPRARPVS